MLILLCIEYSNDTDNIYENFVEYNPDKEHKILTVFDDKIANMLISKKLSSIVTELFIRSIKLNISFVFITQSYFAIPIDVTLNYTRYFIMKIPNKQEFQQIAFNHSSDIDYQGFMNLYKKSTSKIYSFLVIDANFASDNLLCFRNNLLERIQKLLITIDDKIRDEKLQLDSIKEAAKISALSSGKFDKHEYRTGEEILPSEQSRIIEQAKFTHSPLGKALEKQTKK